MRMTWIEKEALCAGGMPWRLENLQSLYDQGVRAIISLTEEPITTHKEFSQEVFNGLGIELLHVPIVDQTAPVRLQVEQVKHFVEAMKAQNKPVYLHCHAGIGRTGTMLHAYYILSGKSLNEAKEQIKRTRPVSEFLGLSDVQKAFLENLANE